MKWWNLAWNVTIGCTPRDECCAKCWARSMYERLHPGQSFNRVQLCSHVMDKPLRKREKTTYFTCNMSDLFHDDVPVEYIHEVFAVMSLACWHKFFVLTKRVDRALEILTAPDCYERRCRAADRVRDRTRIGGNVGISDPITSPPRNIAFGATVGLQKHADERIPILLQIPAWKHFVSYEPALGPVHFYPKWMSDRKGPRIDWVVAGGENHEKARECDVGWFRHTLSQCKEWDVACMIKQVGTHPVDSLENRESWPNKYPEGRVQFLAHDDYGNCHVRGLKGPAGGHPEEWPQSLKYEGSWEMDFGYPTLVSSMVSRPGNVVQHAIKMW